MPRTIPTMVKLVVGTFFAMATIFTAGQIAKANEITSFIDVANTPFVFLFSSETASTVPPLKISDRGVNPLQTATNVLITSVSRLNLNQIPERAGLLILGGSLIGIGGGLRRKRRKTIESRRVLISQEE